MPRGPCSSGQARSTRRAVSQKFRAAFRRGISRRSLRESEHRRCQPATVSIRADFTMLATPRSGTTDVCQGMLPSTVGQDALVRHQVWTVRRPRSHGRSALPVSAPDEAVMVEVVYKHPRPGGALNQSGRQDSAPAALGVEGGCAGPRWCAAVRSLLDRWATWHWIRTGLGIVGFVAALGALQRS
jgi:hypothetical protein